MGTEMKKLFEGFRNFINENTSQELMQKAQTWGVSDFSLDPREVGDSYWMLLQEVIPGLTAHRTNAGKPGDPTYDEAMVNAINSYIAEISKEQSRSKTMDVSNVVMSAARVVPAGKSFSSFAATPLGQELGLGTERVGVPPGIYDDPADDL